GIEYTWIAPTDFYFDLTAGVTNGWTYGHSHSEGEKPRQPTHYARLSTYADLPAKGGLQIGLNYLGRTGGDGGQMTLMGVDTAAKWRSGTTLVGLIQGEFWQRRFKPQGGDESQEM